MGFIQRLFYDIHTNVVRQTATVGSKQASSYIIESATTEALLKKLVVELSMR